MHYFNETLLFLLLLNSSLILTNENKLNPVVMAACEDLPNKIITAGIVEQCNSDLPSLKFLGADFLKRYITYNTKYSEETAEIIAQCIVSPLNKKKRGEKYHYQLAKRDDLLLSPAKAFVRELFLKYFTKICQEVADQLQIKHPPEIKENKKLYANGKFLVKSCTRHAIDYGLSKIVNQLGISGDN